MHCSSVAIVTQSIDAGSIRILINDLPVFIGDDRFSLALVFQFPIIGSNCRLRAVALPNCGLVVTFIHLDWCFGGSAAIGG